MVKATYREACCACKKIHDVYVGSGMMECINCKQLVCLDCAAGEVDTTTFIAKTGKGKVIVGDPDPDMNGPVGWVCPNCFEDKMGRKPSKPIWTDSPSSGDNQVPITSPSTSGEPEIF